MDTEISSGRDVVKHITVVPVIGLRSEENGRHPPEPGPSVRLAFFESGSLHVQMIEPVPHPVT
jgi:hypothetical protein